jgi:hypothetical protein
MSRMNKQRVVGDGDFLLLLLLLLALWLPLGGAAKYPR